MEEDERERQGIPLFIPFNENGKSISGEASLGTSPSGLGHLDARIRARQQNPTHSRSQAIAEERRQESIDSRTASLKAKSEHIKRTNEAIKQKLQILADQKKKKLDETIQRAISQKQSIIDKQTAGLVLKSERMRNITRKLDDLNLTEQQRKWTEMKERELIAEYRRLNLLRVPRSKLLEYSLPFVSSVKLVQYIWLQKRLKNGFKLLESVGILGNSKTGTFEQFTELMVNVEAIKAVGNFLSLIESSTSLAKKPALLNHLKSQGRVFFTCLLMGEFGKETFGDNMSQLELTLSKSAQKIKAMLLDLQSSLYDLNQLRNKQQLLAEAWLVFYELFWHWKRTSKLTMVEDITEECMVLEKLLAGLHDETARQEWKPHVEMLQTQLRKTLLDVAGKEGVDKLDQALHQFQTKTRSCPESKLDVDTQSEDSSSKASTPILEPEELDLELLKLIRGPSTSRGPHNVQLVHDLFLESEFDYAATYLGGEEHWNVMQAALKIHMTYNSEARFDDQTFIQLAGECRNQLLAMVSRNEKMAKLIDEGLDLALLREQAINKAIPYRQVLEFIIERMGDLCAPIRDQTVQQLKQELDKSIPELFMRILELLYRMNTDLISFLLQCIKSRLSSRVVTSYERNWFAQCKPELEGLKGMVEKIVGELKQRDSFYELAERSMLFSTVYTEILMTAMGLDESQSHFSTAQLPTTFLLDFDRMKKFNHQIIHMRQVASLFLHLKNLRHPFDPARLKILLESRTSTAHDILVELERNNVKFTGNLNILEQVITGNDPVSKLIHRRMASLIKSSLLKGGDQKSEQVLCKHGLGPVAIQFIAFNKEVERFSKHHLHVHAPVYDKVIASIIES